MDQFPYIEFDAAGMYVEPKRGDAKDVDPFARDLYRSGDDDSFGMQRLALSDEYVMRGAPAERPGDVVRGDARAAVIERQVPIPVLPSYYDRLSSFTTQRSDILPSISTLLTELHVESRYSATRHRIECSAYLDNNSSTFAINLFQKGKDADEYVVEFQRRSGCVLVSKKIFVQIKDKFLGKEKEKERKKSPPIEGQIELDDETAEILFNMASLKGSEQRREAFRLLCDIAGSRESHEKIITRFGGAEELSALILDALDSGDLETERYVCVFLANLCCGGAGAFSADRPLSRVQEGVQTQVVRKLFLQLVGLFVDVGGPIGSKETKRQVLRCLDALSSSLAREVSAQHSQKCSEVLQQVSETDELYPHVKTSFGRFVSAAKG